MYFVNLDISPECVSLTISFAVKWADENLNTLYVFLSSQQTPQTIVIKSKTILQIPSVNGYAQF